MNTALVVAFREALAGAIARMERESGATRRDIWRAALEVEHLAVADLLAAGESNQVLSDLAAAGRVAPCQALFARLEPLIERDIAAVALSGNRRFLDDPDALTANYLVRYEELARREIALAGITAGDRVLFLGSGPLPISAIEYCRQTGCGVDCVDFVEDAVEISRRVVDLLGLGARMRCHLGRAEHFSASGYSVVMVGVLASPKRDILRNVASTRSPECRLLARTTYGLRSLIYAPLEPGLATPAALRNTRASIATGDQVLSAILGLDLSVVSAARPPR